MLKRNTLNFKSKVSNMLLHLYDIANTPYAGAFMIYSPDTLCCYSFTTVDQLPSAITGMLCEELSYFSPTSPNVIFIGEFDSAVPNDVILRYPEVFI